MAHARPGGPVPRGRPEHDSQMVRPGPRAGLLHPRRPPPLAPQRPRELPRPLRPGRPAEVRPARPPRRRRREGARARPREPRVRGLRRPRGRQRRRGAGGDRGGEARPRPARRDDAARRRLGDAAPRAGALRRRRDPGRHVQRQGRRGGAAARRNGRRAGLRGHAVRPPAAARPDEDDRTRLTSWDRHAERVIVHHRWTPLDHVCVFLTRSGTWGAGWIVLASVLARVRRNGWILFWTAACVYLADGIASLVKYAVRENRPDLPKA